MTSINGMAPLPVSLLRLIVVLALLLIAGCSSKDESNPTNSAAVPTVTSISPNQGITQGGTTVTITGTGFQANATVTIGGTSATNVSVSGSTTITATTPARAAGQVSVVVTNPDGKSATVTNGFTYEVPAAGITVTGVSPNPGTILGGDTVTVTGTGFVAVPTVTFGGTAATDVVITSTTSLTAVTPAHAPGAVNVVVTNPAGGGSATLANGFTYVALSVTSITPNVGLTAGGETITFTGTGFRPFIAIDFGGFVATDINITNSTLLTCKTSGSSSAGQVDVKVQNFNGERVDVANGFTFILPALSVTSVTPNKGSTFGGDTVTIAGVGFVNPAVTLGGAPATIVSAGTSSITAVTAARANTTVTDTVDVVVTNSGGASDTLTNGFIFVAPTTLNKQNWIVDLTYLGGDFRIDADLIQNGNDLSGDYFYSSGGTNFQVFTEGTVFGDSIDVTFTLDKGTGNEASFRCVGQLFSSSPQTFRGTFEAVSNPGVICGGTTPCQGTFEFR